jgi:hypothetical protein
VAKAGETGRKPHHLRVDGVKSHFRAKPLEDLARARQIKNRVP